MLRMNFGGALPRHHSDSAGNDVPSSRCHGYVIPVELQFAMAYFICTTCGTQHAALPSSPEQPPERCAICEDERQYVNPGGQEWTTVQTLQADHHNVFREQETGLTGIGTEPKFAIGQRALLLQSPSGNILWDCISLIDEPTIAEVQRLGGLSAIAISHPHYYSSMVAWSQAFGGVPIYLHADDREWVMRLDSHVVFWEGETHRLGEGLTLIRCGGHFPGSCVLHWADGAEGRGALLTGDTIYVAADRRYVSFMYSYPNLIPLDAASIENIVRAVEPLSFDRIYGGWWESIVTTDARAAVLRSATRYQNATRTLSERYQGTLNARCRTVYPVVLKDKNTEGKHDTQSV
jgi:glyoxylase-like metal-dependent hydrolase (beta-lactamase superfamily II)